MRSPTSGARRDADDVAVSWYFTTFELDKINYLFSLKFPHEYP